MIEPDFSELTARVDALYETPSGEPLGPDVVGVVEDLIKRLEAGQVRAAAQTGDGTWSAVPWVKRGILLAFGRERSPRP